MPIIKILPHETYCPNGTEIDVDPGFTICVGAYMNSIELEQVCRMSCACTTCHVLVHEGYDSLNEVSEDEQYMLDDAWGYDPKRSRLSCQAIIGNENLVVEIPEESNDLFSIPIE